MTKITLNTKPVVIKNNDIKTIEFKFIYPVDFKLEYIVYNEFLSHLLSESTKLIPDETEFYKQQLRMTLLDFSFYRNCICNSSYLVYSFSMPRENLISDYNLEESFKFAIECIKNPIIMGEYDEKKFSMVKNFYLKKYESAHQNIYVANQILKEPIIDPDEIIYLQYENYGKLLKNITWEDLRKYYEDNIINNKYISYVYGNISEEKVEKLFKKYLNQDYLDIEIDTKYFFPLKLNEAKYQEIETKFNQSELVMEYQVQNMKEEEKTLLSAIINFLNAQENNLIFNALRVKNSLVYDAYVTPKINYGVFLVEAFIDSKNKDKVINIVKQVMESLKDEDLLNNCLKKLIKGFEVDLLREEDSLRKDLNNRINDDLNIYTVKTQYEELKKLKVEDIIKFLDRIKLTSTILFKEGSHD